LAFLLPCIWSGKHIQTGFVINYGRPSGRIVLLRRFDERGFVFFTKYDSRKGNELKHNNYA